MIRYRENMSQAEEKEMMEEINIHEELHREMHKLALGEKHTDEEWEEANQMEDLKKAALNRGQP